MSSNGGTSSCSSSCSSIRSVEILREEDPAVNFLCSAQITCCTDEIDVWPEDFFAAPPNLGEGLMFNGLGTSGWYKTGFTCYAEDGTKLVAKFKNGVSAQEGRRDHEKGPFKKNVVAGMLNHPGWKTDYVTMLDDYQQQVILSILSYLYDAVSTETLRIAYLMPVLVQAESPTHSWYGIVEKSLPVFKKPNRWLQAKWQYKDIYMKFRAWCKREHEVILDDPQGLYTDGTYVFFTDGIIQVKNVERKYQELLLLMQGIRDEEAEELMSDWSSSGDEADDQEQAWEAWEEKKTENLLKRTPTVESFGTKTKQAQDNENHEKRKHIRLIYSAVLIELKLGGRKSSITRGTLPPTQEISSEKFRSGCGVDMTRHIRPTITHCNPIIISI